ncbi:hypothetical protein [Archangium sp.]|jgi:hypothetical protein|uniref:hypothetical protein n=1 Tax=Archangium sp. TaxID=1872627 RepID=UPI002ED9A0DC
MSFNTKMFPGALVVAGLMAACGGETQGQNNEQGETARIESGLTETLVTRGALEPITCKMDWYSRTYWVGTPGQTGSYKVVEQCYIGASFTHQYRTGQYVTFKASADGVNPQNMYIGADGSVGGGVIDGPHTLYTGTANGYVDFQGNEHFAFGYGQASGGILAHNTCLLGLTGTWAPIWVACEGGKKAEFYGDSAAYLYRCANTTAFTCP